MTSSGNNLRHLYREMYKSQFQYEGGSKDSPDYVYYNADIINNTTRDIPSGNVVTDPQVRFNETRDTSIIKNAADYNFSIVRFSMNGPNLDLPLFIPDIKEGTGQTNVNLTNYGVAMSLQQTWNVAGPATLTFNIVPTPRLVVYSPETQNPALAPTPRTMANNRLTGIYNPLTNYKVDDIVGSAINIPYGYAEGPFYRALAPSVGIPVTNTAFWLPIGDFEGQSQDLSTRYYWVYTYQHWLNLMNQTLSLAHQDLYTEFQKAWIASGTITPFPYATFAAFKAVVDTPQITYNDENGKFSIWGDSDGFGQRLTTFTNTGVAGSPATAPRNRLFMNTNTYGLFNNFPNFYFNTTNPAIGPFAGLPIWVDTTTNGANTPTPEGYTVEINFINEFYQNVVDFRIPPYAGVAPLGFVPLAQQKPYWKIEQEAISTDSLWSPISSLVFTSTLLPIKAEATGAPVVLGNGNLGFSSATVQSAFQPIITDITADTSSKGSYAYRGFIYYTPTAEYRLTDFSPSKQDIRNIDIQVYWKCRLDNQLYPVQMYNLSSVSLKVMFKKRALGTKATD